MPENHPTSAPESRPGRPSADADRDIRGQLLDEAAAAFAERGFHGTSVRSIAEAAGVNAAMVHYYFGNKRSLYGEVLRRTLDPLLQRVWSLTEGEGDVVRELFHFYQEIATEHPWLPKMLVRDVLAADGPARSVFVEQIAPRLGAVLPERVAREVGAGHLRSDLDPRLTTLSLVSLAVFPMVAAPVAESVLGFSMDQAFFRRLAEHNIQLFLEGAGEG